MKIKKRISIKKFNKQFGPEKGQIVYFCHMCGRKWGSWEHPECCPNCGAEVIEQLRIKK